MTTLIALEELKQYLEIDDGARDALLSVLIQSVSSAAEIFTGRFIINRVIEEELHFFDRAAQTLQLNFYPVKQIIKIIRNGQEIDAAQIAADKESGILRRQYDSFCGTILVSYEAGIAQSAADVPQDIKLACAQWIKYFLSSDPSVKTESLGDYSVSYAELCGGMPAQVAAVLEKYKRYGV
ncbi:MAG: phage head-tail connector protein [Elusimicrobium sp.]|nr:phage head-tail connector protein [Elusimicrobium sp.]